MKSPSLILPEEKRKTLTLALRQNEKSFQGKNFYATFEAQSEKWKDATGMQQFAQK